MWGLSDIFGSWCGSNVWETVAPKIITQAPGKSAPRSLRIIVLLQAWDLPMHGSASYFIKITQSESH